MSDVSLENDLRAIEAVNQRDVQFALANDPVSTVLVGYSTMEHLERAITVVNRGPLPPPALELLRGLWTQLPR